MISTNKIVSDPNLLQKLNELAGDDQKLESIEVDRNQDGYLDKWRCNLSWSTEEFNKIELALFNVGLIQSLRAQNPIFSFSLNNPDMTPVLFRNLDSFNPLVTDGHQVDLKEMNLGSLATEPARLNFSKTLLADDGQTPENEGLINLAQYLKENFYVEHNNILTDLGIANLNHLTPREAVLLSTATAIDAIHYSSHQASQNNSNEYNSKAKINDNTSIEQLLSFADENDDNGICRNYAVVIQGILEALKLLQNPETTQLNTTYCTYLYASNDKPVPGTVLGHAWNGFFTITSKGIEAIVVDATFADTDSNGIDPAQSGTNSLHLDQTPERFLTLVHFWDEHHLINKDELCASLVNTYLKQPYDYHPIDWNQGYVSKETLFNITLGSMATRLMASGYDNHISPENKIRVLQRCLEDLKTYQHKFNQVARNLDFSFSEHIGFLNHFSQIVDNLPDDLTEKESFVADTHELLKDAYAHSWLEYEATLYPALSIAERHGFVELANQLINNLKHNESVTIWDNMLRPIMQNTPPERQAYYQKQFDISINDPNILNNLSDAFFEQLEIAKSHFSHAELLELNKICVNPVTYPPEYHFDIRENWLTVNFNYQTDSQVMQKTLEQGLQIQNKLEKLIQNTGCAFNINAGMTYEEMTLFLDKLKLFFDQVSPHLIQYKEFTFGRFTDLENPFSPKFAKELILNGDFSAIKAHLSAHRPASNSQEINTKSSYMALEKLEIVNINGFIFCDKDNVMASANNYYPIFSELLNEWENNPEYSWLKETPLSFTFIHLNASALNVYGDYSLQIPAGLEPDELKTQLTIAIEKLQKYHDLVTEVNSAYNPKGIYIDARLNSEINEELFNKFELLKQNIPASQLESVDTINLYAEITISGTSNNINIKLKTKGSRLYPSERTYEVAVFYNDNAIHTLNQFIKQANAFETNCRSFEIAHKQKYYGSVNINFSFDFDSHNPAKDFTTLQTSLDYLKEYLKGPFGIDELVGYDFYLDNHYDWNRSKYQDTPLVVKDDNMKRVNVVPARR